MPNEIATRKRMYPDVPQFLRLHCSNCHKTTSVDLMTQREIMNSLPNDSTNHMLTCECGMTQFILRKRTIKL